MPIRNNRRIFYATQKVGIKGDAEAGNYTALHGVQDLSMNANFNLEQVFQLGQLAIYENIENIPDVEVTMSKVLDGYVPIYLHATQDATDPTLAGRQNAQCIVGVGIYTDSSASVAHSTDTIVEMSGMFVSSLSYEFPVDGNFSETVTLVGNDRIWKGDTSIVNSIDSARADALPTPGNLWTSESPQGSGNINRRQDLFLTPIIASGVDTNGAANDPDCTVLPSIVDGITSSGTIESSSAGRFDAHVQSVTCSVDLGRTELFEWGRLSPYTRYVEFPTEVTCDITTISTSGDFVSATEDGILNTSPGVQCGNVANLSNETIRVATCEGTRIYLGRENKLASVSYGGGGADGGNVETTYSFTTFNTFTVMHEQEESSVNANIVWASRHTYLSE